MLCAFRKSCLLLGASYSKSRNCLRLPPPSFFATFNNRRVYPAGEERGSQQPDLNRSDLVMIDFVRSNKDLSSFETFRKDILLQFASKSTLSEHSFDGTFLRACVSVRNYQMGKLYIKKMEAEGKKINTATLSKFLQLSYFCRDEVDDVAELEGLCRTLQSHSQFLDGKTKECLILGLSITDAWRDALKLLREDEATHTSPALNALVDRLLAADELNEAESLMDKIAKDKRLIYDFTYEHWIKKCELDPNAWTIFSNFLARHEIFPNQMVTEWLKEMLERRPVDAYSGVKTTVNQKTGSCRSCGRALLKLTVSPEEFAELKEAMVKKVLEGPDVFIGSRPEEVESFKRLVHETGPYDVVIDGLNVAYLFGASNAPRRKMQAILSVVDYFDWKNKNILVLGRNHMKNWYPPLLKDINRRARFFMADNLSRDDPFLLYAALQSQKTKIVSDDIFRDHQFKLGDQRLAGIFRTWQRSSQLQVARIDPSGRVHMQHPLKYRTVAQFASGYWHIPYDDGTPRYSYQLPETWLCLKSRSKPVSVWQALYEDKSGTTVSS